MSRKRTCAILLLAGIAAVLACTLFYSGHSLNHDTSWYLVSTRMFMDGARLYQDIVEINPPLAFYLTVPPLLLADLVPLSPSTAFCLYISSLGTLSALWVCSLAVRANLSGSAVWALSASVAVCNLALAVHDFGQREHLLLIFAMPYLHLLFLRDRLTTVRRPEQVGLAAFAFCGLGLKPYFLLIPAGVVIARFGQSRDFREFINLPNMALGAILFLYLGFIAAFHPLYLEEIVPTASLVYSSFDGSIAWVLVRREMLALAGLLGLAILCRAELDRTAIAMLGGLGGAFASYLIQFKGWNYQIIPTSAFIFLATMWLVYRARSIVRRHVPLGVVAMLALILSLGVQLTFGPYVSQKSEAFGRFVKREDEAVLVLSSNVSAAFPFVNEAHARWSSRYSAQWIVAGGTRLLDETDCSKDGPKCEKYRHALMGARSDIIEDFASNRPAVVYIDDRERKSYFGGSRFDYMEFLMGDSEFERLWQGYHLIDRVQDYQVWSRNDEALEND